ncbi:MAG: hypothetical protein Q4C65_05835 [Eubacteriales bacterium]|nr:hypothetical protein [Eubacteriales bacterium]
MNNEVDFCKVYDMKTKERVEKILLANRISYCCHFEEKGILQKLLSSSDKTVCTFRIHDEEVPRARELVRSVLGESKKKKKENKK